MEVSAEFGSFLELDSFVDGLSEPWIEVAPAITTVASCMFVDSQDLDCRCNARSCKGGPSVFPIK